MNLLGQRCCLAIAHIMSCQAAHFFGPHTCNNASAGLSSASHQPLNVLSCSTGAQALVAWSLQKEMPNLPFSMVAEEDSDDLR